MALQPVAFATSIADGIVKIAFAYVAQIYAIIRHPVRNTAIFVNDYNLADTEKKPLSPYIFYFFTLLVIWAVNQYIESPQTIFVATFGGDISSLSGTILKFTCVVISVEILSWFVRWLSRSKITSSQISAVILYVFSAYLLLVFALFRLIWLIRMIIAELELEYFPIPSLPGWTFEAIIAVPIGYQILSASKRVESWPKVFSSLIARFIAGFILVSAVLELADQMRSVLNRIQPVEWLFVENFECRPEGGSLVVTAIITNPTNELRILSSKASLWLNVDSHDYDRMGTDKRFKPFNSHHSEVELDMDSVGAEQSVFLINPKEKAYVMFRTPEREWSSIKDWAKGAEGFYCRELQVRERENLRSKVYFGEFEH